MASLGLSLPGYKPLAAPSPQVFQPLQPIQFNQPVQTFQPSQPIQFNQSAQSYQPLPFKPVYQNPQVPAQQVPGQSAFQGMQNLISNTGITTPTYTGGQMMPVSGIVTPNINLKPVTPKKTGNRTINYTAADLTTLRNEDLKLLCKELGLTKFAALKKEDLIILLLKNPITTPKVLKVIKPTLEEDVTIIPATNAVAPISNQMGAVNPQMGTLSPQTMAVNPQMMAAPNPYFNQLSNIGPIQQIPISQVIPPTAPLMLSGLGPLPAFNIGSIGPIQTGPAAVNPPAPISIKDLLTKQTGETVSQHAVRTEITEKASTQVTDPQVAANIGSTVTNQAFLGVTYNNDISNLLGSVKL